MHTELQDCINLRLTFPGLTCGFELVQAEDRSNHIGFYAEQLVGFTKTCQSVGMNIPFIFHTGETLLDTVGSHNADNSNLYDALMLNSKRIGHGYALLQHQRLVEKVQSGEHLLGALSDLQRAPPPLW